MIRTVVMKLLPCKLIQQEGRRAWKGKRKAFYNRLEQKGVTRRDFMKYCTFLTATLGLNASFVSKVADVFAAPKERPPVIWLNFAECTGCFESFIRSSYPWVDEIVLELINLEYQETIMAAAGHQVEESLKAAVEKHKGKFLCITEGAIATKYDGAYGKIGGRTFLEVAQSVIPYAKATIAYGTCASFGGVQAARPNPGGFKGVGDALKVQTINIPGCPPNPVSISWEPLSIICFWINFPSSTPQAVRFCLWKNHSRPVPPPGHFEAGEFVCEFGSEEAEKAGASMKWAAGVP
ncbi:MAG: hydrogenase small subunit [Desulfobacterales bacterium]